MLTSQILRVIVRGRLTGIYPFHLYIFYFHFAFLTYLFVTVWLLPQFEWQLVFTLYLIITGTPLLFASFTALLSLNRLFTLFRVLSPLILQVALTVIAAQTVAFLITISWCIIKITKQTQESCHSHVMRCSQKCQRFCCLSLFFSVEIDS